VSHLLEDPCCSFISLSKSLLLILKSSLIEEYLAMRSMDTSQTKGDATSMTIRTVMWAEDDDDEEKWKGEHFFLQL